MSINRRINLTICGSFGFYNAGDEAVPEAILDLGSHLGITIEANVVGRFDRPAMAAVVGLGPDDSTRLESLRGQRLLMSGGGIIENSPNAVIFRCNGLLDKHFSARASLFGISVEPGVSYNWRNKWRLRRTLRQFDIVYTRDELSEATLNMIAPKVKTETIGDLVLWLEANTGELPDNLELPDRYIAVNLAQRWTNDPGWHHWISLELSLLARKTEATLLFVPISGEYDDDKNEHRLVADKIREMEPRVQVLTIETSLSPRGIAALLAKAELVVSMRLHGCVMAYAQQTVSVGLGYHPKLYGFFQTVKLKEALLPQQIPRNQSQNHYGYKFSELGIKPGELFQKAMQCMAGQDFSMLSVLKQRSASALLNILDKIG